MQLGDEHADSHLIQMWALSKTWGKKRPTFDFLPLPCMFVLPCFGRVSARRVCHVCRDPPSSPQGSSLRALTSSSCCCYPEGLWQPGPRLSHSPLAGLHSSNHANYISNCNGGGLVSGSHTLERFINMHQRGRQLAWAPTFKGQSSQGAEMARFTNYSCSSTLLARAPHAPRQTAHHLQSELGQPTNQGNTTPVW